MATAFGHEGDRLSAFLDDELTERDALAVARHLDGCDPCRDELEQLRRTRAALRSLPEVNPSLAFMVETAVLGPETPSRRHHLPLLAGAVAIALVGTFLLGGDRGTVRPPVDELVVDHVNAVEGGPVVTPVQLVRTGGDR